MIKTLSDKTLLTSANEQEAFRIIYERYWEVLYKKALNHLKCSYDAEDAVQEIFISLWRNKKTVDASNNLSAYLFTALKYHVIKQTYKKARKGFLLPLSVKELEETELSAEEAMHIKEIQTFIKTEVSALPKRMQQIYLLSRENNLQVSQIATHLNISEQTVKNTLTTALKKLRQKLEHSNFIHFFL
ncbi:MAG: sigma-70 family RNA polymerase sigma factor [Parafilimonas sp.]